MRVLIWRMAMRACEALSALLQPVVRAVVRLAGRLAYWRDQAEIGWLLAITRAKLEREQRAAREMAK